MANKKKYQGLDEVGILGVAKERSAADIRLDAKRTSDYIRNKAAANTVRPSARTQNRAAAVSAVKKSH